MTEHEASRTLVKSPPELWAECSEATSLARHLGEIGEIRITKLEPETAVAWEGNEARGTVRLEPSGWGTRVILTAAEQVEPEPVVEGEVPEDAVEAVEVAVEEQREVAAAGEAEEVPGLAEVLYDPAPPERAALTTTADLRAGFFARLMQRLRGRSPVDEVPEVTEPEPVAEAPEPEGAADPEPPEPEPEPEPELAALASVLDSALDSLGRAHHRPFSRA
jgi:hypothetical protein